MRGLLSSVRIYELEDVPRTFEHPSDENEYVRPCLCTPTAADIVHL